MMAARLVGAACAIEDTRTANPENLANLIVDDRRVGLSRGVNTGLLPQVVL